MDIIITIYDNVGAFHKPNVEKMKKGFSKGIIVSSRPILMSIRFFEHCHVDSLCNDP